MSPGAGGLRDQDAAAGGSKREPAIRWKKAEKEWEDGKTIYELKGRDPKGKKVKLEISADGEHVMAEPSA
jgi:hypothetical protein